MLSNIIKSIGGIGKFCIYIIPAKRDKVAITLHNIKEIDFNWFKEAVEMIREKYQFIDPLGYRSLSDDCRDSNKVLLTFDDGFRSNFRVAEEILEPLEIKAMFFVTYGFIGLDASMARDFSQAHFYPSRQIIPSDGEMDAMSWEEVRKLASRGHSICAHTHNHPSVSSLNAEDKVAEIVDVANKLEQKLGQPVRGFAYPFGELTSIDEESVRISRERFDFAFSNMRGSLAESPSMHFLFRQNLVPGTPLWMVEAIIEGKFDWRYQKGRRTAHTRFSDG